MIVRHFISWVRTAPASERAEATRSMARAWLLSDLSADDMAAAEGALLMMLDDPSPLVRQAMAETFARSADAPAAIIQALAQDQASIALPVLEHSPLLLDADLVDLVAIGTRDTQCAIARRIDLPASVCAALAEVGCAEAVYDLVQNPYAELIASSWDRIVERHGHVADIRETILKLDGLPAATRLALAAKLAGTLAQFAVAKNWLSAERADRIASEAMNRSTVQVAATARGNDMRGLVQHLRATDHLTSGLILRALLSGNIDLFDYALVELTGLPQKRVSAILQDISGPGVEALLSRAGLPASTFPAFMAALATHHEMGFVASAGGEAKLRRRIVERVLTLCETDEASSEQLLLLLRRFAMEAARDEARMFCDELAAETIRPSRFARAA